jgi:hypothetical protein
MTDIEKLRIMLPHWIEHNQSHAREFKKWADSATRAGSEDVGRLIERAHGLLLEAESALSEALELTGGPADTEHHHDGHH